MALDPDKVKVPGTDEWWAVRLSKKLGNDLERLYGLQDWMDGTPPRATLDSPDSDSEGFQRLRKLARINLAELIVNAVLYRMKPLTFKTAAAGDENGDTEVNRILKANDFAVLSTQAIEWMLSLSRSYLLTGPRDVWAPESGVLMTAENPTQMITEDDPTNPGYARAALKIYRDDLTNSDVAVLYRADSQGGYMRVMRHEGNTLLPKKGRRSWAITPSAWTWEEPSMIARDPGTNEPIFEEHYVNDNGDMVEPTFTRYVPVQKLENRGKMGEFEKHLDALQRINHTILQRMIIIAFQAFRQRGIKGVPNTDEDGNEIDYTDIFKADPGALWLVPEAAEFWESGQADLGPVLTSVKDDIIHLAVASSTPLFSVVPDAANGSAEGAALQREGLIFKTEACIDLADGAFRRMVADAFQVVDDELRADVSEIESVWASPRRSSLQERATAAVQAMVAGVPWRTRMQLFVELTPDQIAAAETERLDDAFMMSLTGQQELTSIPGITDPPRQSAPGSQQ